MISFIVIGRNESQNIQRCIQSVLDCIIKCKVEKYEIIYVDSRSEDDSIEIVKKYQEVTIIKLIEDYNAAIARNLGANLAKGDVLFFIDGDMTIDEYFLNEAQSKYDLISNIITGIVNIVYRDFFSKAGPGFVIIIGKKIWESQKGMNVKYTPAEDSEFLFRLNQRNIKLRKIDKRIAIHYSKNWVCSKEMLRRLFQGDTLCRGMFYRDYFLSWKMWKFIFRNEYSSLLLFVLLIFIFLKLINPIFITVYLILLLIRIFVKKNLGVIDFFVRIIYYFMRDISVYFGFLFYFPSNKKNIQYEKIQ